MQNKLLKVTKTKDQSVKGMRARDRATILMKQYNTSGGPTNIRLVNEIESFLDEVKNIK
jgi:hypothetical protein